MLVVSRKVGESLLIGESIRITVSQIVDGRLRLSVQSAPDEAVECQPGAEPAAEDGSYWLLNSARIGIGPDVGVVVIRFIESDRVRVGIEAPNHYPILRDVISETVGTNVNLIDSGAATAHATSSRNNCNPCATRVRNYARFNTSAYPFAQDRSRSAAGKRACH